MRGATVAAVLLGMLAVVSAGDISRPTPVGNLTSCLLPVSRITCIRDWRSGFVAGFRLGYTGFDALPPFQNSFDVCSPGLFNQTSFDMSVLNSINDAQSTAPRWYGQPTQPQPGTIVPPDANRAYFYPSTAPITQVIVLKAPNPWGAKFGTIAAILFGYLDGTQNVNFAVCGNAVYANYFLDPVTSPPPPTLPVTLKASYSSGLSEGNTFTALGSLDGKCGIRGTGYLGGDPWKNSKLRLLKTKKPCFTQWNNRLNSFPDNTQAPPQRLFGNFECNQDPVNQQRCRQPCRFNKKTDKHGPSFSCSSQGITLAVGKFGPITFAGLPTPGPVLPRGAEAQAQAFSWVRTASGTMEQVPAQVDDIIDGEAEAEEEDEE